MITTVLQVLIYKQRIKAALLPWFCLSARAKGHRLGRDAVDTILT